MTFSFFLKQHNRFMINKAKYTRLSLSNEINIYKLMYGESKLNTSNLVGFYVTKSHDVVTQAPIRFQGVDILSYWWLD